MKTYFIILLLMSFHFFAYPQKGKRYHKKGYKFLNRALDSTTNNDKQEIAFVKAKMFFIKSMQADSAVIMDSLFQKDIRLLRDLCVRKSLLYYDSAKVSPGFWLYEKAAKTLEEAIFFDSKVKMKNDTTFKIDLAYYQTGRLFQEARKYSNAIKYYKICTKKSYSGDLPYISLSKTYQQTGEIGAEISILEEGYKKHPESERLLTSIVNYHIAAEDYDNAIKYLDKIIEQSDENENFYLAKASILSSMCYKKDVPDEELTKIENLAIKYYKIVLKINPNQNNALYNLGTIFYNRAVKIIMQADKIPLREKEKYKSEIAKSKVEFKKALPCFEKAFMVDNTDKYALQALKIIYLKLEYKEQSNMIKKIMEGEKAEFVPVSNIESLGLEK